MFLLARLDVTFRNAPTELSVGAILPLKPNQATKMLFRCRVGPQVVATGALDKTNRPDLDLDSVGRFGSGGKSPHANGDFKNF